MGRSMDGLVCVAVDGWEVVWVGGCFSVCMNE